MDPLSLILQALLSGAISASSGVAQDAYNALKSLIKEKLAHKGQADSSYLLEKYAEKPDQVRGLLKDELAASSIDKDPQIIELATELLKQLKESGLSDASFTVNVEGGTVQGLVQQNSGVINQNFS